MATIDDAAFEERSEWSREKHYLLNKLNREQILSQESL